MKDTLLCGDCAEKMRTLADNSIDAIVTDPPYGLAFMGADFDTFHAEGKSDNLAFQESMTPIFAEALRVAKPGAHLLAFGGTRTYHRLACAIEDAGWEIRDCIFWCFGSGFPKSMDVSKAIDKMLGAEREKVQGVFGKTSFGLINDDSWQSHKDIDSNIPATPEAAAWQGYGTCLKPACEPIVVARKPLEGTVAANVLKYGTGAINIDGCRVPTEETWTHGATKAKPAAEYEGGWKRVEQQGNSLGRFPSNLIHDGSDEVLALFPYTGKTSGGGGNGKRAASGMVYGQYAPKDYSRNVGIGDSGSAARFFYCAKASRSERGSFNDHCTVKPLALMRYLVRLVTRKGGIVLDPFMGSGTTGVAAIQECMNFVGIERDPHYFDIASRRITEAKPIPPTTTQQELPLCE